jgi:hypothetical protein
VTLCFAPKLEPGERELVRVPDRGNGTLRQGLAAILVAVELVAVVAMDKAFGIGPWGTSLLLLAGFGLLAFWVTRWRLIVTDRRVLFRHGPGLMQLEDIRLDEIGEVRSEMGAFAERLAICARGRETVISLLGIDTAPFVAAIRQAREAAT